jgi:hypothetical protein
MQLLIRAINKSKLWSLPMARHVHRRTVLYVKKAYLGGHSLQKYNLREEFWFLLKLTFC